MTASRHPLARTTPAIRAELRAAVAELSDKALADRYGITPATVRKWRGRDSQVDRSHCPETLHCTLTPAQQAVAMAIRRTLWLPLDDLLMVVREFLNPEVSRSGLARCMKRHGLNKRLPDGGDGRMMRAGCKSRIPGFIHMETRRLPRMADGASGQYLLIAIDRVTRWLFMHIYADRSDATGIDFLRRLKAAAPMRIEKLLTGNGSEFANHCATRTEQPDDRDAFEPEGVLSGIEGSRSEPKQPRRHDVAERFSGLISDVSATPRFRDGEDLQAMLERYEKLYNQDLPQRALGNKTPFQVIHAWKAKRPDLFDD